MDIFANYATDQKLEDEGAWVKLDLETHILVGRAGNKKYGRLLSTLVENNKAALDAKTDAADALSDSIMVDVFAESILLGWKGPMSFKGVDMPYTLDNAKTLLAVKDFRTLVSNHSKNVEHFRAAAEASATKK